MRPGLRNTIAAAACAVLLAACGGAIDSGGDAGDAGERSGGTFVVGLGAEPPGLVRAFFPTQTAGFVGLAIQESLVASDRDGEIIPSLAESWEVSDDGLQYTFTIRQGVTWHDGEPLTVDDVVFSLQEVLPLTPNGATVAPLISDVTAPDDSTVVLTLSEPYAPLLPTLTPSDFNVVPKHLYEGTDLRENEYNTKPVGTGPFTFESWESNDITLTANEDYWGGAPGVDRLVFRVIPDPNAAVLALQTGEIDFLPALTDEGAQKLNGEEAVRVEQGRAAPRGMTLIFFNTSTAPFDNPEVRKALLAAIDREQIVANVMRGEGEQAKNAFPTTSWAFPDTVDYTADLGYSPDDAASMLDDAGFPVGSDGSRFPLRFRYTSGFPGNADIGAIVAANWESAGVAVEQLQDELVVFQDATFKQRDFDAMLVPYDSRLDPQLGIARAYVCEEREGVLNTNPSGYCNPELDALFAAGAAGLTEADRQAAYADAAELIERDLPAAAIVQDNGGLEAIRSDWTGIDDFFSRGTFAEFQWQSIGG